MSATIEIANQDPKFSHLDFKKVNIDSGNLMLKVKYNSWKSIRLGSNTSAIYMPVTYYCRDGEVIEDITTDSNQGNKFNTSGTAYKTINHGYGYAGFVGLICDVNLSDISNITSLKVLSCGKNLSDLSKLTKLEILDCGTNTSDLSRLTNLRWLRKGMNVTDMSHMSNIKYF